MEGEALGDHVGLMEGEMLGDIVGLMEGAALGGIVGFVEEADMVKIRTCPALDLPSGSL